MASGLRPLSGAKERSPWRLNRAFADRSVSQTPTDSLPATTDGIALARLVEQGSSNDGKITAPETSKAIAILICRYFLISLRHRKQSGTVNGTHPYVRTGGLILHSWFDSQSSGPAYLRGYEMTSFGTAARASHSRSRVYLRNNGRPQSSFYYPALPLTSR